MPVFIKSTRTATIQASHQRRPGPPAVEVGVSYGRAHAEVVMNEHSGTWMDFINIRLSDGNQTQGHAASFYLYEVPNGPNRGGMIKAGCGWSRGEAGGGPAAVPSEFSPGPSFPPPPPLLPHPVPHLPAPPSPLFLGSTAKASGPSRELASLGEDFVNQTSEWNFFPLKIERNWLSSS